MKNKTTTLGERLQLVRVTAEASQSQIASLIGTSVTVISSAENDRSIMSPKFLNAFIEHTSVNREWLIDGKGDMGEIKLLNIATNNNTKVDPWKDEALKAKEETISILKEEKNSLQTELNRVWGMITHLTGGKIADFQKVVKGAGLQFYHLPGAEHSKSLTTHA